jgi:FixJ family two-component response regulator
MSDPAPIVFAIDDDPSVRKALVRLLKSAGFRVEAFASAEEFLQQPLPDAPSCVVLDLCMPGLCGLEAQRALAERDAAPPVVFVTGHGDIPTTVEAMKAGAVDFLPKPFTGEALLAAVRQALARHALARRAGEEAAVVRRRADSLTPRERQVMALVVAGMPNKQVGFRLAVGEKTIKVHRARVMRKMRAGSLAELVRMAEKIGAPVLARPRPA